MADAAGEFPDDLVDSLVTALLAVNSYSLEKVWNVLPRLQDKGLKLPLPAVPLVAIHPLLPVSLLGVSR